MTLDEAIKHCEEVADTCENAECGKEHKQLAEWLKALKTLKKTAHWDNITCRCSNCGLAVTYSEAVSGKYKFCYNCGSRMEGGTHEKVD